MDGETGHNTKTMSSLQELQMEHCEMDKKRGGREMKTGKWIELWDKENNRLLRIVYNPYLKPIKEVIAFWIPKEYQSLVKGKISR